MECGICMEDEEEEGQLAKSKPNPTRPTEEEVERHNKTHIPYRSWCPHCVRGRAVNDPHRKLATRRGKVSVISMDYMYMFESAMD